MGRSLNEISAGDAVNSGQLQSVQRTVAAVERSRERDAASGRELDAALATLTARPESMVDDIVDGLGIGGIDLPAERRQARDAIEQQYGGRRA